MRDFKNTSLIGVNSVRDFTIMVRTLSVNITVQEVVNQVSQCVRKIDLGELYIACQNLQFYHIPVLSKMYVVYNCFLGTHIFIKP